VARVAPLNSKSLGCGGNAPAIISRMPSPASEVLGAMITPAVLISASGTLVLSTSNRLSRVVDRVRVLSAEAERPRSSEQALGEAALPQRRHLIASQLHQLAARVVVLRSAMTSLYVAIGLLIATSMGVGLTVLVHWSFGWVAIALGLAGSFCLLWGSVLLVREARLAIVSTLEEMAYARELVGSGK
jgi:Protein of unknown function (DUF2721)